MIFNAHRIGDCNREHEYLIHWTDRRAAPGAAQYYANHEVVIKVINVLVCPGLQPGLLLPTNVVGPATPVQHERSRPDLSRLEIAHEDLEA